MFDVDNILNENTKSISKDSNFIFVDSNILMNHANNINADRKSKNPCSKSTFCSKGVVLIINKFESFFFSNKLNA